MGKVKVSEDKLFLNVFPTLKLEERLKNLFQDVEVLKVATDKRQSYLRIHIQSHHIIEKEVILQIEKEIKEQLFTHQPIQIQLHETYHLSSQYNLENLIKEYQESMILELSGHSLLASNVLSTGKLNFDGDVLTIELPDSIVSRGKEKEINTFLMNIISNRFALKAEVQFKYRKQEKKEINIAQDTPKESNTTKGGPEENSIAKGDPEENNIARGGPEESNTTKGGPEENSIAKGDSDESNITRGGSEESNITRGGSKESNTIKWSKKNQYYRPAGSRKEIDPSLIFGKDFDDETIELKSIISEMGDITIRGQIIKLDTREIKNNKTILMMNVTDFTDTIGVKMFVRNEELPALQEKLKKGVFIKVKGFTKLDTFDGELTILSVVGIKLIPDFTSTRQDNRERKRVELHCHTKMSDMDGVSDAGSLILQAHQWGHRAVAITDHGVVQAFPEAHKAINKLPKDDPFKVIYGVEAYVVDDLLEITKGAKDQTLEDTYVVFDVKTTGFSPIKDKIINIGALKIVAGEIVDTFSAFVNPKVPIPFEIARLTEISDETLMDSPEIEQVLPEFLDFIEDSVLVTYTANFGIRFLEQNCRYQEIDKTFIFVDALALARVLLPTLSKVNLENVSKALNMPFDKHKHALDDAKATSEIFLKLVQMLKDKGVNQLKEINHFGHISLEGIRKLPTNHIIILAKNDMGRFNLYKLISESHITYYRRRPRIPKSLLIKHREGLIIGGACENGEIYQAILHEKPYKELAKLAEFYDYYEIQPLGNNDFMIEDKRYPSIRGKEDLIKINKEIIKLGERFNKPVVATGDVHFLRPEDELYRRIIMAGKGFKDADNQPPLYFRTTQEMLEEFSYLDAAKAEEVVIDNTIKIAEMIEKITPISSEKRVPIIENSDTELREICYKKAHETYGEVLPRQVKERLDRELNSIISNGYAVMYIIAQKLVWKSIEEGYLVGSRGSVGSSLAATMAGFTEVNPLRAHYRCKQCFYSDFDSPEVRSFAGSCGFDMPDKNCPLCNTLLTKDGFDIPFECFLGFEGDKEPDIDLNFSGDYQARAHLHAEELFDKGSTYKAGTIGTIAEKTAYGFVKGYFDERKSGKRNCEIERILEGCKGIRRSTGQHPGGIIVLPEGHDINEFTPIQRAANDMNSNIITTHFDYKSIEHNLLKLDILGHDNPTILKALEEYITSDALDNEYNESHPFLTNEIPLDDKEVLTLFEGTKALGIKPEDISDCKVGCLGLPEFGTDFVIKMVQDAKPKTLSDLIRISGLSHGENVWLNNAQELIRSGDATISTCICTRDDIMVYLIDQGLEASLAFNIMESVRRGNGLLPEWEEEMKKHKVPDWYIWSCKKITYMFPKAHAAAYVMMAYKIAYCKINYPLAYYGAYFGIRAKAFDYELMCQGKERLNYHIKDYLKRKDILTPKEEATLEDMKLVQEMYARGFEFTPIDIYKAKANRFIIVDGKLMPSFITIEGLGEVVAQTVVEESKKSKYLSIDDFRQRTKVNSTVLELMEGLELFGALPKSNQLSLFDL